MSSAPPVESIEGTGGALEFLLRRMQRSRDFPALSDTIRTLNRLSAAGERSVEQLADVIVRDFALTNKVLKVVNSAYYAGFAGKVGTISRAIVVLGIEPIRALAASLILFEQFAGSDNAERVRELIGKSMFGALVAREAAIDAGLGHGEEAFLAAMFHNLGELLVAFYLPEEDQAIQAMIADAETTARQAQMEILGVELDDLGTAVGQHWNFPRAITHSMKKVATGAAGKPANEEEALRYLASFASEVTEQISLGGRPGDAVLGLVKKRYAKCLSFEGNRFEEMLQGARSEYRRLAEGLAQSENAPSSIRALAGLRHDDGQDEQADEEIAGMALPDEEALDEAVLEVSNPEPILLEGLQEATAMLAEGADLNQVAQVVLETMYRAFGLRRIALCLRDVSRRQYAGRLGFGDSVEDYLQALRFPEAYERDVFHVALQQKTDVHIADLEVAAAGHGIPAWYHALTPRGSLLFLPLVVQNRPVGCILIEHPRSAGLAIEPGTLRLLRALRNQLVLGLQLRSTPRH